MGQTSIRGGGGGREMWTAIQKPFCSHSEPKRTHICTRACTHELVLPFPDISKLLGLAVQEPLYRSTKRPLLVNRPPEHPALIRYLHSEHIKTMSHETIYESRYHLLFLVLFQTCIFCGARKEIFGRMFTLFSYILRAVKATFKVFLSFFGDDSPWSMYAFDTWKTAAWTFWWIASFVQCCY